MQKFIHYNLGYTKQKLCGVVIKITLEMSTRILAHMVEHGLYCIHSVVEFLRSRSKA